MGRNWFRLGKIYWLLKIQVGFELGRIGLVLGRLDLVLGRIGLIRGCLGLLLGLVNRNVEGFKVEILMGLGEIS